MDKELQQALNSFIETAKTTNTKKQGDSPEDLIGKKVIVNSHKVSGATGNVTRYIPKTHHYWVWLEKPIKTKTGRKSNWHKCNAGNCRLWTENDIDKQLKLF